MDIKLGEYVDFRDDRVELYKRVNDDGYEEIYAKINIRNECTHDCILANAKDCEHNEHKQFQKKVEDAIINGLLTHKTILYDYEKDQIIFRNTISSTIKEYLGLL